MRGADHDGAALIGAPPQDETGMVALNGLRFGRIGLTLAQRRVRNDVVAVQIVGGDDTADDATPDDSTVLELHAIRRPDGLEADEKRARGRISDHDD